MTAYEEQDSDIRVGPLEEQWPNIRFLGLGIWWAWIWLCYNSTALLSSFPNETRLGYVFNMYLFSTAAIASIMIIAALFWKKTSPLLERRETVTFAGAVASLATLLLAAAGAIDGDTPFIIAAIGTGMGTSAICLRVGQVYGAVGLGESLTGGALSLLAAALLYFVGIGLPPVGGIVFTSALPFASALVLSLRADDPFALGDATVPRTPDELRSSARSFQRLVTASCIVAFTAGVGKGLSSVAHSEALFARTGAVIVFLIGVVALLILWAVNRKGAVIGASRSYTALMIFGIAVMLLACFDVDIAYLGVGKEALWLMFSVFLSFLSFRYSMSPVRYFGFGQAAYFVCSTIGWAVGVFLASQHGETTLRLGICITMALLVVVVLVYVLPERELASIVKVSWKDATESSSAWRESRRAQESGRSAKGEPDENGQPPSDLASAQTSGENAAHVQEAPLPVCSAEALELIERAGIGREYARAAEPLFGLSARELEIMALFAQGRSANWIAEHLVISKNTVRTHLRAVYAKLDIHTRQELLDFIASTDEGETSKPPSF